MSLGHHLGSSRLQALFTVQPESSIIMLFHAIHAASSVATGLLKRKQGPKSLSLSNRQIAQFCR